MDGQAVVEGGAQPIAGPRAQDREQGLPGLGEGPDPALRLAWAEDRRRPLAGRESEGVRAGRAVRGAGRERQRVLGRAAGPEQGRARRPDPGGEKPAAGEGRGQRFFPEAPGPTAPGLSRLSEPSTETESPSLPTTASIPRVWATRASIAAWTIRFPSALPSPIIWS